MKETEQAIQQLWNNIKRCKIYVIGLPEGEETEKGADKILEVTMADNFPILNHRF